MCGGFLGKVIGGIDPIFRKNNPVARAKRQAQEGIANADAADVKGKADQLALETNDNQVLQAETVAQRRRKAAQSLLGRAGAIPGQADDGTSNLAQGRAYGARATSGSLG